MIIQSFRLLYEIPCELTPYQSTFFAPWESSSSLNLRTTPYKNQDSLNKEKAKLLPYSLLGLGVELSQFHTKRVRTSLIRTPTEPLSPSFLLALLGHQIKLGKFVLLCSFSSFALA